MLINLQSNNLQSLTIDSNSISNLCISATNIISDISINSNNSISSIDLIDSIAKDLDVINNTQSIYFNIQSNNLQSLTIDSNSISNLSIYETNITSDLSINSNNSLSSINFNILTAKDCYIIQNKQSIYFNIQSNNLQSLTIDSNSISNLSIQNTNITSDISINSNNSLSSINFTNSTVQDFNISYNDKCFSDNYLSFISSNLNNIYLYKNCLTELYIGETQISSDISVLYNTSINSIGCSNSNFNSFVMSKNNRLSNIEFQRINSSQGSKTLSSLQSINTDISMYPIFTQQCYKYDYKGNNNYLYLQNANNIIFQNCVFQDNQDRVFVYLNNIDRLTIIDSVFYGTMSVCNASYLYLDISSIKSCSISSSNTDFYLYCNKNTVQNLDLNIENSTDKNITYQFYNNTFLNFDSNVKISNLVLNHNIFESFQTFIQKQPYVYVWNNIIGQLYLNIDNTYYRPAGNITYNVSNLIISYNKFGYLNLQGAFDQTVVTFNNFTSDITFYNVKGQTIQFNKSSSLAKQYVGAINFEDFNSYKLRLDGNQIINFYMSNNQIIKNLDLSSNLEKMTLLSLRNNRLLQYIDIPNENIIQTLEISQCSPHSIILNKTTFPKLKNIILCQNYDCYYKNGLYFYNQMQYCGIIKQNIKQTITYYSTYSTQHPNIVWHNDNYQYISSDDLQLMLNQFQCTAKSYSSDHILYIADSYSIKQLQINTDFNAEKFIMSKIKIFDDLIIPGKLLTYLDVSNTNVQTIKCQSYEKLTYFDASNTNLKQFYTVTPKTLIDKQTSSSSISYTINSINSITKSNIQQAYFNNTNLQGNLTISNASMSSINIDNNLLNTVDISNNRIQYFDCNNDNIKTINISNQYKQVNEKITSGNQTQTVKKDVYTLQYFHKDKLKSLDISKNKNVYTFICINNQLKNIYFGSNLADILGNTYIDVSNSTTSFIPIQNMPQLKYLNINNCPYFHYKNYSNKLTQLYCSNDNIQYLDLSDSKIEKLDCSNNNMKTLKINPYYLKQVNASYNKLKTFEIIPINQSYFNLNNNDTLHIININNYDDNDEISMSNIKNLIFSFSHNFAVNNLYVMPLFNMQNFNSVKTLNINHAKDIDIKIENKNIDTIYIQNCSDLQDIHIDNSQINNLIVNNNSNLTKIYIYDSKFKKLVIKKNVLNTIVIDGNLLQEIIVLDDLQYLRNIQIYQSNNDFNIEQFFQQAINFNLHNCNIKLKSEKISPYFYLTENVKQLLINKNCSLSFY